MASSSSAQRPEVTSSGAHADSLLSFESEATPKPRPVSPTSFRQPNPAPQARPRRTAHQDHLLLVASAILAGVAIAVTVIKYAREQAGTGAAFATVDAPTTVAPPTSRPSGSGSGTVSVNSNPPGALVLIDGISHGVTPLKLSLPAGSHTLVLQNGGSKRSVPIVVEASTALSEYLDLAPPAAPPTTPAAPPPAAPAVPPEAIAGWVAIKSPLELQIFEGRKLIGLTSTDRLMLPVGTHDLELTNQAYGFQTAATVQVLAGKTVTSAVALPEGSLSINALPWAEVFVDGKSIGTTPLANVAVPIGPHEVTWKHPTLGERSQTVVITLKAPSRMSIDFHR